VSEIKISEFVAREIIDTLDDGVHIVSMHYPDWEETGNSGDSRVDFFLCAAKGWIKRIRSLLQEGEEGE
jgi:hypothetical protein